MDERVELEMAAEDVLAIYELMEANAIRVWIDGGWGVDALLGRQSRRHKDLDLVVQQHDEHVLRRHLAARGYHEKGEWYAEPWNYLLVDDGGHELDLHLIRLDARGNGLYGDDDWDGYSAHALTGQGTIAGHTVRCIAAHALVGFHTGYELTDKDFQDVSALCEAFGLDLPEEYARFLGPSN